MPRSQPDHLDPADRVGEQGPWRGRIPLLVLLLVVVAVVVAAILRSVHAGSDAGPLPPDPERTRTSGPATGMSGTVAAQVERAFAAPRVELGATFSTGGVHYAAGWRVAEDRVGFLQVRGLTATAISADPTGRYGFNLWFFTGERLSSLVHCTAPTSLTSGRGPAAKCFGSTTFSDDFDRVTVTQSALDDVF